MSETYKRDIEEEDETLDRESGDPIDFWEKKQRELVTSVVDYNLQGLSDLVVDQAIDLDPSYQRRLRWDEKRQSKLIESFLMNVPVPPVFLNEDEYGSYSVIDGKQRITAISNFMRGILRLQGLDIFHEVNGKTIDELPSQLQRAVRTRPTLRAVIILRQSDPDVKFNVFQRLNTGGVKLNAQEIRNSAFPGLLNDRILELSIDKMFHELLGIKVKTKSAIYQEMRDAEFVLRFFTFRENWSTFSGGMKRHMDKFMEENKKAEHVTVEGMRKEFIDNINKVKDTFGEHAFRRWEPEKKSWRKQILASLYDAQMFAVQDFEINELQTYRDAILQGLKNLFSDTDFRKSIDAATNTPALFQHRIRAVRQMISDAIGR
ncbi:MAG: DUF262 domain-containing protein [Pyrinomonadaceae bacterium]|nr:DUF262 domain-containing protein [Pyrinomonadaceae bacterium]